MIGLVIVIVAALRFEDRYLIMLMLVEQSRIAGVQ